MDFSFSSIMAGFIFGVIGVYLLKRGKQLGNLRWIVIGVSMIAYPYFVSDPLFTWGTGAGLLALAYFTR